MKKFVLIAVGIMVTLGALPIAAAGNGDRVRARVTATGDQEAVAVSTEMTGKFRVEVKDGELDFRLNVKNNSGTVVAAHIHCAAPGANGPVGLNLGVEPFVKTNGQVVRGEVTELAANGCGWTSVDDVAAAIEAEAAYVNVHTMANPSGEIRGDLSPR